MTYWHIRKVFRFLALLFAQQCSGKQRVGFGLEWCQLKAFHEGPCQAATGAVFERRLEERA
jgi:hypothetical protein